MSFVSLAFLAFAAAVMLLYFLVPKAGQWMVLLAASLFFYLYSDARSLLFILFTGLTVWLGGLFMQKLHTSQAAVMADRDKDWQKAHKKETAALFQWQRRAVLVAVLLANFGVLAFLKYYGFVAANLNTLLGGVVFPMPQLFLPLGISFYTFMAAGYLIDCYRKKYPACQNFGKLLLFLSFFPAIIQGPISRYDQLGPQLEARRTFDFTQFKFGWQLILWGFFKKLLIGDMAAKHVGVVLANYTEYAGAEIAVTMLMFMAQIYGDFSGGIDIARGVAQALGIDMAHNFARPHFAMSVSDYWRRWHITLGAWMKDYLLYPLSLSKAFGKLGKKSRKLLGNYFGKLFPTCLAMLIVFLVVGIWHGSSTKYIAFGLFNGACIIGGILIEVPLRRFFEKHPGIHPGVPFWRVLATLKTLFLVFISKYFAAGSRLMQSLSMLKSTFTVGNFAALPHLFQRTGYSMTDFWVLVGACCVLFVVSLLQERGVQVRAALAAKPLALRWGLFYALLFAVLFFTQGLGSEPGVFFYAQY